MRALEFDPVGHRYIWRGEAIPALTEVLAAAGLNGDLSRIPQMILARKAAIGEELHRAAEMVEEGAEVEVDPAVEPYLLAYRKFLVESGWHSLRMEWLRAGRVHGLMYGCRVDRLGALADGVLVLLELKTSYKPSPGWALQLMGQKLALPRRYRQARRMVVHLAKDGTYQTMMHDDDRADRATFAAALELAWWKRRRK